jgi:hypothetical protein
MKSAHKFLGRSRREFDELFLPDIALHPGRGATVVQNNRRLIGVWKIAFCVAASAGSIAAAWHPRRFCGALGKKLKRMANHTSPARARRPELSLSSYKWAAGLVCLLWTCCPTAVAQKTPPVLRVDPFIQAIETMKHAVAHVDCLAVTGAQAELVDRVGSAFFVSEAGDFLTAAHVIQEVQRRPRCASSAITLPADDWRPQARTENLAWFPFKIPNCKINNVLDIAVCPLTEDLSARRWELHLRAKAVEFEWDIPPDGTPVAFTGFPLRARDPMTFRAAVAAYLIPWSEEAIPELVLDHGSLPGFSGSPVYLADGKIVAVLVKGGKGETDGVALARPASVFREMIGKRPERK